MCFKYQRDVLPFKYVTIKSVGIFKIIVKHFQFKVKFNVNIVDTAIPELYYNIYMLVRFDYNDNNDYLVIRFHGRNNTVLFITHGLWLYASMG